MNHWREDRIRTHVRLCWLSRHGTPEIFTTLTRVTSDDFADVLKEASVRISMDGRGRCMDNVFIERLWRSLKYECIYLRKMENGFQA